MKTFLSIVFVLAISVAVASAAGVPSRWSIDTDGSIFWNVKHGEAHQDNVEMSGKRVSVIVTYGVDATGALSLSRFTIFPTFRTIPQDTRSHISTVFGEDDSPPILLNRAVAASTVQSFRQKGILRITGRMGRRQTMIDWTRTIFPSTDKPAVIETIEFTNSSRANVTVEVEDAVKTVRTSAARGLEGAYIMSSRVVDPGERSLKPGEETTYVLVFSARKDGEPELAIDTPTELNARTALVESYLANLQLQTPDRILNTAFSFAKIRTTESIFQTKAGLMHGPGGGRYYAAIWANDQGEYGPPFFPFLGDPAGNEAAANAFRLFATYMNPDFKPIPSSIVAEGAAVWHGAGDRGDMAMLAYGASRFALASGNKETAEKCWPLIEWCLEYCHRHLTADGVVHSDHDELEGRFPAGNANLCTSCLYYDALNSAVDLGRELDKPQEQLDQYAAQAVTMRAAIEKFFGATVDGFNTYRYYDGNTILRAWICIPLTVGIFDRKEGTIDALFSPRLWTDDGLATAEGSPVFWDRSTLYALRGVFAAGETEKALNYLQYYSRRRLLGEHVPYPVEAYPEGNQSHLAAESALYCRIFIEGLFGIRPTGLRSFDCTPRLPKDWPSMALRHVRAFGGDFDLTISQENAKLRIDVLKNGQIFKSVQIAEGDTARIEL